MDEIHVAQKNPAPGEQALGELSSADHRDVVHGTSSLSAAPSLIDPRMEHDSCGVGFVASALGKRSHDILEKALTALARLEHRGAVATDGRSSDGVGIMTGIPKKLLLEATGVDFDEEAELGVGMMFWPKGETRAEGVIESCLVSQELRVLCWRDVPTCTDVLGKIALDSMPVIRQVLVGDASSSMTTGEIEPMDKRLYLARKQFERMVALGEVTGYVCSLSSKTVVYKALCLGSSLPDFYPDLASPDYVTNFAVFHQRYATNTLPAWHRAQPARKLGHNGEINTVWGNRARMAARASTLPVECQPVFTVGGTDSTSLDEAIEMLSFNGRTIAESVRMLLPPAVVEKPSPFLQYHGDISEPWDGPAAISFSDGVVVGAALDRNGLRPCRYAITSDGLVVAGSEAGLVDLDPETLIESGRLGPGQMIGVDMAERKIYHNEEMLDAFDAKVPYANFVENEPLVGLALDAPPTAEELMAQQRGFGYTKEDVRMILQPMAASGKDPVWSMGDDTPLAFLARSPRPLYAFFRQRFAQVTNPAIDPLREAIVVSLHTRVGPWAHLLDKHAPLPGISLETPFLSLGQMKALREGKYPHNEVLHFDEVACLFSPEKTLEQGLDELCQKAVELVLNGTRLMLLTDRGASAEKLPIPMAMAVGAVHQALVAAGMRTLCGLAVEAGDCRDIHHAAVLIAYGAGALCPWLMLETARSFAGEKGQPEGVDGEAQTLHALDAGLAKVMSKMGISVVNSYRGGGLFDILGLHETIVSRCFPGTPAPLSGIGFAEVDRRLRQGWIGEALPPCWACRPAGLWLGTLSQGRYRRAAHVAAAYGKGSADGCGKHQGWSTERRSGCGVSYLQRRSGFSPGGYAAGFAGDSTGG